MHCPQTCHSNIRTAVNHTHGHIRHRGSAVAVDRRKVDSHASPSPSTRPRVSNCTMPTLGLKLHCTTCLHTRLQMCSCKCPLSIHMSIHMSINMSIHMFIHVSTRTPIHMSVCMSTHMSTHIFEMSLWGWVRRGWRLSHDCLRSLAEYLCTGMCMDMCIDMCVYI